MGLGIGTAAYTLDNAQGAARGQQPYLAKAITYASGSSTAGDIGNVAAGVLLAGGDALSLNSPSVSRPEIAEAGEANSTATESGSAEGPSLGGEWYDHFTGKYGAGNVEWMSGSGRSIVWPDELPFPTTTQMFRVRPPDRSSTFSSELNSVVPKPAADAVAHHVQPLRLNGADDGLTNGSWEFDPWHQDGHDVINNQVNQLPYGTEFRILPP